MKDVVLKVHPLSRCVLLSEYGHIEPLLIGLHDLIFSLLTSAPVQEQSYVGRSIQFLTTNISIQLPDDVANWIFQRPYHPGALLYKMHKDLMCRYAQACVKNNKDAWASIEQWLFMHNVADENYTMDAAYKCWLRWNKQFRKKNPVFFSRIRGKASVKSAKKQPDYIRQKMLLAQPEIEVALSNFLDTLEDTFDSTPKCFPNHARAYFYKELGGLSELQTARLLGMNRSTVGYGYRTMQNWLDTYTPVQQAFTQSTGLQVA